MKRMLRGWVSLSTLWLGAWATPAMASDAATSATAGRGPGGGNAAATARYEGEVGFARTNTQTGRVNLARGVAVGIDDDGLSLSISNAIATSHGPAVASTLNLSIDRDGSVATSSGVSVANGPIQREATAGGQTSTGRGGATAQALASGRTDRFGQVRATTHSESRRPAFVEPRRVRVLRGR